LRDDENNNNIFVAVIQDITNRIESIRMVEEAKEHLHQQAKELARSNAELEQFAYVASHDLQEPLRMISSYLQFLDLEYRSKLSPQAIHYYLYINMHLFV
jgi:light-regulated signal transduction histidine kinase (bacteriophytochrome)